MKSGVEGVSERYGRFNNRRQEENNRGVSDSRERYRKSGGTDSASHLEDKPSDRAFAIPPEGLRLAPRSAEDGRAAQRSSEISFSSEQRPLSGGHQQIGFAEVGKESVQEQAGNSAGTFCPEGVGLSGEVSRRSDLFLRRIALARSSPVRDFFFASPRFGCGKLSFH